MNKISIAHTAVTVKDMEDSLRFYTQALGLEKVFEIPDPQTGNPWIVYLNVCKGQFIELFYGGTEENPWRPELEGFNHLCFVVDDINAATQKITDAGFEMDIMPNKGCDNNWQAWTRDPNGVRIELMTISPDSPHAKYM